MTNLKNTTYYTDEELKNWIEDESMNDWLADTADRIRRDIYGDAVYVRGLIEFSNYCKNDCFYCGIRKSNKNVNRYRLTPEEIIQCADIGYELGFRTYVMQGGEDPYYTDDMIVDIVKEIKAKHPDTAITLSLGIKPYESFKRFYKAGADRYLLRQETSDNEHFKKLHPAGMTMEERHEALWQLKEIGYQVGGGFMVDSPYQTTEDLIKDLRFLQKLEPDMIGIGPFLTSHDTPFKDFPNGSYTKTLRLVSILRILFPYALIPATTALGTIHPLGREKGLKAGANVLMPNLSPTMYRKQYQLYDNKICTGDEAAECRACLSRRVDNAGYEIVTDRGDVITRKAELIY